MNSSKQNYEQFLADDDGEKEERERQKRQEKGIFVEDATWKQIREAAASLGLEV